jgi:hypothetical protein
MKYAAAWEELKTTLTFLGNRKVEAETVLRWIDELEAEYE